VVSVGVRWLSAMPSALVTSAALGLESIDHPTTRRENVSRDDRAVHLAFAGGVFGDVGDPEPVGLLAPELALDEVAGGRHVRQPPEPWAAG